MPRIKTDRLLTPAAQPTSSSPHITAIRLPPVEHAYCMAHGGMTATIRRALTEMMEREAHADAVDLQMRNYIEIGALLVADTTALRREWEAAKSQQKRTQLRMEWDKLRAQVAALTHYDPPATGKP